MNRLEAFKTSFVTLFSIGDFSDFLLEYMTEADDEDVEEIKQQLEETMGRDEFRRELSR